MKKFLSVLLALTLALSLSVMTFAAPATTYDKFIEAIHSEGITKGLETALDLVSPTAYDEMVEYIHTDEFKAEFKALVEKADGFNASDVAGLFDDFLVDLAGTLGIEDVNILKDALAKSGLFDWVAKLYMPATPTTEAPTEEETVPETGSAVGGIAIFATLSVAAAAAFVCAKKK
jgi:hypothetical protein